MTELELIGSESSERKAPAKRGARTVAEPVLAPHQLFSDATNRCQFKLRSRKAESAEGQLSHQFCYVVSTNVGE